MDSDSDLTKWRDIAAERQERVTTLIAERDEALRKIAEADAKRIAAEKAAAAVGADAKYKEKFEESERQAGLWQTRFAQLRIAANSVLHAAGLEEALERELKMIVDNANGNE